MKIILTLLSLAFCQASVSQITYSNEPTPDRISTVSPNRDTLWLLDEPVGRLIGSTWENHPAREKKPVIIFVKELPELRISSLPSEKRKRKKNRVGFKVGQASL